MKKNIFIILIIILITTGCGFKVVNQSELINLQKNTLVDNKFYYAMSILLTAAVTI